MSTCDWMRHGETNVGPGMVYDSPEEKQIERQRQRIAALLADRDALAAKNARLRVDAARWEKLVELWHASTELLLAQDEDGAWSITVVEPVEALPSPGRWTGDTPDAAIDALAALKKDA